MHSPSEQYRQYQQQPQQQQQRQQQQQQQPPQRAVFMTRIPEQRPEPEQQAPVVVIVDEETLRLFVRNVYLYGAIFILATSIIWLVVSGTKFAFYPAIPVPAFVWIILAIALLMITNCIPQARQCFPINWVMTILIVILITLAGSCVMDLYPVLIVLAGLTLSFAIVGVFYALGALCPQQLLPGILCTACMSCVFVLTLFTLFILNIVLDNPVICLVFGIILFCFIILMLPFHAQYIHGRFEIVPLLDMLHCSLSIFIHFTMMFYALGLFYIYHKKT